MLPLYKNEDGVELFDPEKLEENTERFFQEIVLPKVNADLEKMAKGEKPGQSPRGWYVPDCVDAFQHDHTPFLEHLEVSPHFNEIASREGVQDVETSLNMNKGFSSLKIYYKEPTVSKP